MDSIIVNFSLKRDNIIKPNNTLDLNDVKKERKIKARKIKALLKPQLKKNELTVDFKNKIIIYKPLKELYKTI